MSKERETVPVTPDQAITYGAGQILVQHASFLNEQLRIAKARQQRIEAALATEHCLDEDQRPLINP